MWTSRSLYVLALALALVSPALAQEGPAPVLLPDCATSCARQAFMGGLCAPDDLRCICTDPVFQLNVTTCTTVSCTIPEGLAARNASLTSCGAPVRDRTGSLTSALWTSVGLATFFVIMRFGYKLLASTAAPVGLDDWLTLATLVFGVTAAWVHLFGSIPNGLGKDIWTLRPDQITEFSAAFYHSCWTYFLASALLKMAMIAFFLRVFPTPGVQRLLKGSFIFTGVYGGAFVITALFQCIPIHHFWTGWDGLHSGSCANANAISWANAIGGIALDLWIIGIPLWQLRYIQLHWKRKVAVVFMLLVGTGVTVVSILRLQSLVAFATSHNTSWDFYNIAIWSGLEISIGIVCACLPTLRLLLIKIFPRLGDPGNRFKGNYAYYGKDRSGNSGNSRGHQRSKPSIGNEVNIVAMPSPSLDQDSVAYGPNYGRTRETDGDEISLVQLRGV
ncbi:CFEM domain-containing protein [Stachybotrys elegans]|uniref:CFEM domain-containing protein n=1 Tax=Stachybotrys elegans TaxID=80388 RepID=A0A8K0WMG8_9HYPO|nr:CFEM domain-containing protein [Stachybotrys elegans]